jgi:oligopeptidase B
MTPEPPIAPRRPHTESRHGETVEDDYRWLRDRDDPEVRRYLEADNAYAEAMMRPTRPLQSRLYDEMLSRIKQTDLSVPERRGEFFYYTRTEEGRQYRFRCRRRGGLEAPEQLLLDENALAEGQPYLRVGAFEVSPDHRLLAFAVDTDGGERFTLRIKDLTTGGLLPDVIRDTYASVEWGADSRTLFYNTVDAAHRPYRLHRHVLGTPAEDDELIYEEADEAFFLDVYKTKSGRYLMLHLGSNTTSEARFLDAREPGGVFRTIRPRRANVEYVVEHRDDRFFVLTNDEAVNFKLCTAPVSDPSRWDEVLAHREDVKLEAMHVFAGHLALVERKDGIRGMRIYELPAWKSHAVEFPETVHVVYAARNPEFDTTTVRVVYTSLVTPRSVFDYDMKTRERVLMKEEEVLGGYDRRRYRTERVHATADDGRSIPVSLVYREAVDRDGPRPLLLYGYGAYGSSVDPVFDSGRLSLLDRGMIYAIAHVRGGGDLGRPWYDDGKLLAKRNTFTDFIACAEELVGRGLTAPDRLVIRGGSAGGLLVGAVLNMRPELFRAAVAKVPFVDVMSTMLDATLPLTVIEREEWGDPRDPRFYEYMRSYSPYDNVAARAYPDLLITAGLNDPRVAFWEPAKWTARLRASKTDTNLLLLKTDMGAGHAGPSGRYDYLEEIAFEYAFILTRVGGAGVGER